MKLCCVPAEAILLGFQHFIVMLGTTVLIPSALVPQMGGGKVGQCKINDNEVRFLSKHAGI